MEPKDYVIAALVVALIAAAAISTYIHSRNLRIYNSALRRLWVHNAQLTAGIMSGQETEMPRHAVHAVAPGTYVEMPISVQAFAEIQATLEIAGYKHAIGPGKLFLNGIAAIPKNSIP